MSVFFHFVNDESREKEKEKKNRRKRKISLTMFQGEPYFISEEISK